VHEWRADRIFTHFETCLTVTVTVKWDFCMRSKELKTALAEAVWRKDEQLAADLIRRGADVNARYDNDFTLLHLIVQDGDMRMARLFICNGADIHTPNAKGNSPLDLARVLDDVREINGKKGERFYTTLITAFSQRHAQRIKAQHRLRRRHMP